MTKKKEVDPVFMLDFISSIEDPRIDRTKKHSLETIMIIAICAVICGAKSWNEIEVYGTLKLEFLSKFLNLENGVPSHDTFRRFFMILMPNSLQDFFTNWVSSFNKDEVKQICIDGKTLRGSKRKGDRTIHVINAYSTGLGLSLGQLKTDKKSNEITAIPELLDSLDIKDTIVSVDALNCQTEIADKIVSKGGDYLFCVKSNQEKLHSRIEERFEKYEQRGQKNKSESFEEKRKLKHGRFEKRSVRIIKENDDYSLGVNPLLKWKNLKTIIEISAERIDQKTGEVQNSKRYYISSRDESSEYFLNAVKDHWQVENLLHWHLDVTMREDDCRCRVEHSAVNFSSIRQLALGLVKKIVIMRSKTEKLSVRTKMLKAGWDNDFLLDVLLQ
ncbi:MAG: ISAs1 family transposase [Bacteriovoracaceae bacterium]|nr:ISAs1 family transposase [Bacteriovoracaceae bacterium]